MAKVMLTPKMQMVGCRSAADLAFEGEGGGGALVGGLQIYFCKCIFCLQIYRLGAGRTTTLISLLEMRLPHTISKLWLQSFSGYSNVWDNFSHRFFTHE